jgi:hypothetical protein
MGAYGAIIGGVIGGVAGSMQKGSDINGNSYLDSTNDMNGALSAYKNLVGAGPGQQDMTNSVNASRNYAGNLLSASQNGGFNMAMGQNLANQQFAGQRTAMEQSFQDQMAQANRAAAMSGRGTNDPILRARLAQSQTQQQAQLMSNQSSAAVGLGLQFTQNSLGLQGQQVGVLGGLANQAMTNQSNLFNMSSSAEQLQFGQEMTKLGYENSRGGGMQGMMQGAMQGASAGSGMGGMMGGGSSSSAPSGGGGMQGGGGSSSLGASTSFGSYSNMTPSSGGSPFSGGRQAAQSFAPQASYSTPLSAPQIGVSAPSNFAAYPNPSMGYQGFGGGSSFSYK